MVPHSQEGPVMKVSVNTATTILLLVALGSLLLVVNIWFIRTVWTASLAHAEPQPIIAPFRISGKEDPNHNLGSAQAQRLVARLGVISQKIASLSTTPNEAPAREKQQRITLPIPLSILQPQLVNFGKFSKSLPSEVSLKFAVAGFEARGLGAFFTSLTEANRRLEITVHYQENHTIATGFANMHGQDPFWIRLDTADEQEVIDSIAYTLIRHRLAKVVPETQKFRWDNVRDFIEVYQELAELNSQLPKRQASREAYKRLLPTLRTLISRAPEWNELVWTVAQVAENAGEGTEALGYFQLALNLTDEDDDIRSRIAQDLERSTAETVSQVEVPLRVEPATETPDFSERQGYLGPAPEGIDARYAWELEGGKGAGVQVVMIATAVNLSHEQLRHLGKSPAFGGSFVGQSWEDFGTAAAGILGASHRTSGIKGICPDASIGFSSPVINGIFDVAVAIREAALSLKSGDIITVDLQGTAENGKFVPMTYWEDVSSEIAKVTRRGIIVVLAAGNGGENLDLPIYRVSGVNRSKKDSGEILVGAGVPPPGTHGKDYGPDRSKYEFSNYGSIVDVQGWGTEVTTLGYGDLQGGANKNRWYTDAFSGTNTAIVAGALCSVQGVLHARGKEPLTATEARELLRTTGSEQQPGPGQPSSMRVGSRPDLRQLILAAFAKRN